MLATAVRIKMREISLVLAGAAGFVVSMTGGAITTPANAAPVNPNGAFNFSLPGPNSVDTTNITSDTSQLTLGNGFPGASITSFIDPFNGNPNNFCATASAGCTAAHPPGFLFAGSSVLLSALTLPINTDVTDVPETATAITRFGATAGNVSVEFDYTNELTSILTPTTATSVGSLTIDFFGNVGPSSSSIYTQGQSADMSITCAQPTLGASITCGGKIETPILIGSPSPVPEPASMALLGSALLGFGVLRRRRGWTAG